MQIAPQKIFLLYDTGGVAESKVANRILKRPPPNHQFLVPNKKIF